MNVQRPTALQPSARVRPPASVRVAFIGAGFVAHLHARALSRLCGLSLAAVVEPDRDRAARFAARFRVPRHYATIEEMLAAERIDRAHVLTPPAEHAEIARRLIERGIHVLVEKPMAASAEACRALVDAQERPGCGWLFVNHNFVYHPAFVRLSDLLRRRVCGPPEAMTCTYALPLRQLETGALHHWMFERPVNLVLEQAVHPFSQIIELAGPVRVLKAMGQAQAPAAQSVPASLTAILDCHAHPVQLHLRFGATFPCWRFSVLCSDGVIEADIVNNRVLMHARGTALEPFDALWSGGRARRAWLYQDARNAWRGLVARLGLSQGDAYFQSMAASIRAFHDGGAERWPLANRAAGASAIVRLCEDVVAAAFGAAAPHPAPRAGKSEGRYETLVIGGTGFIGRHVVKALVDGGKAVGVLARHDRGLPDLFSEARVTLIRGDARQGADLASALRGVRHVINAVPPPVHETWLKTECETRAAISALGEACLAARVERLVHVSSTAALYLGARGARASGATLPDPQADLRASYARAKALAERLLMEMHRAGGLPVCLLRPGIVVGEGGTPFHSGVGLLVNGRHFLGWSDGNVPLPFVLAGDVAAAALSACTAKGAAGRAYILAGDVRMTAKEYVAALAAAMERPLVYHPQSSEWLWLTECAKWLVKRLAGRAAWRPSYRDLRSRAFLAAIDSGDAKRDLTWTPVADRARFVREAIAVHARGGAASLW